jgi:hypothetical protein
MVTLPFFGRPIGVQYAVRLIFFYETVTKP